ncbi:two-component system response regulator [Pseudoduganella sp. GCM10020061]|uniref:response regulator n=1 Tax=Pseudoduganella sp. GCM10020061 TaxID=3317345 RepID=UPI00363E170B
MFGFDQGECEHIAAMLSLGPAGGPGYFCLHEDSLQEPDLYMANGENIRALAALSDARPCALKPALLVGRPQVELPYPVLPRPVASQALFAALASVVAERAEALAALTARGLPQVAERRRRQRPDFDLTDPADYQRRRKGPPAGAVLIVDKGGALRDHISRLFSARKLSVEWTDSASTAVRLCDETAVAVVLINTSTPGVDPYALCAEIKQLDAANRIAVVLLVGDNSPYHTARARAAGVRGLLDKPVADRHLEATLKKLLSLPL